ncbi:MAG: hypothetical protein VXZ25_00920, partial [Pseudomonadota bacterium]|nr:hypothetical protein [Pseudomonadota bacterium]
SGCRRRRLHYRLNAIYQRWPTYVLGGSESLDRAGTKAAYIYQYRITAAFLTGSGLFHTEIPSIPWHKI